MLAMVLADGPRSLPEIEENFHAFLRRFGFFAGHRYHDPADLHSLSAELRVDLQIMMARGWVERSDGRYALTALGQREAAERLDRMRRVGSGVRRMLQPESVTQVAVVVHLLLAAVKLPAGLLSQSVGLLNDAADTLLDGLSSLLVHVGIRLQRERAANAILVVLMLATGGLALVEALRRLLGRSEPKVDLFAFAAILTSGLVCAGLGAYQRYVGLRTGNLALITQSIDSRNHVLTALGVTAGLIAARLGADVVDGLVGVVVAIVILRSGTDAAADLVRTVRGQPVDLSRFQPGFVDRLDEFRQAQLRDWMLYLVARRMVRSRAELVTRAQAAFDFDRFPVLREVGLGGKQPAEAMIAGSLAELKQRGWVEGEETVQITAAGLEHLERTTRRPRRAMRPHWRTSDRGEDR